MAGEYMSPRLRGFDVACAMRSRAESRAESRATPLSGIPRSRFAAHRPDREKVSGSPSGGVGAVGDLNRRV